MWVHVHVMVGCIVLVPVEPPRYGVVCWVAKTLQGKGFATAGLPALVAYAWSSGATGLDTYTRFQRS
jgi:RimJ/RimL family protein N-acetyltransferase